MGTLYFGGKIYTLEDEDDSCEAVYVKDGRIEAVGSEAFLRSFYHMDLDKEVDLKGNVMYPGFVDSHMHLIGHGERLLSLDLSTMKSADEIYKAIENRAKEVKAGEWIIAEGWNDEQFDGGRLFHRKELDLISSTNPILLKRVCRHASIVNSKAIELAGITPLTPDPSGGVIVKDEVGHPTGYLLDQAQELIYNVLPKVTDEYVKKALQTSIHDCLRLGLVGGHSEDLSYYLGFERTYTTFKEVIDGNSLKFRTNLLVHHRVVDDMHELGLMYGSGTNFIELGAMKIFVDGALGGRTALLSSPYHDDPSTMGVAIHSADELEELIKHARTYQMPIAVHAIGDQAFDLVLTIIEKFPPLKGQRDRLIHGQILRDDLIQRTKRLPVIIDIQPHFVASDFPWVIDRVGVEKMKYCYAWKTLLDEGLLCAGGSDAPIEPVNPLLGIHAAVNRQSEVNGQIYTPEERISVFEAIRLYTQGSATAIGMESTRGKIAKGYLADFTILTKDLLMIPPNMIVNTEVAMTIVDDTIMYDNNES